MINLRFSYTEEDWEKVCAAFCTCKEIPEEARKEIAQHYENKSWNPYPCRLLTEKEVSLDEKGRRSFSVFCTSMTKAVRLGYVTEPVEGPVKLEPLEEVKRAVGGAIFDLMIEKGWAELGTGNPHKLGLISPDGRKVFVTIGEENGADG